MKRWILTIVVAATLSLLIAGCGKGRKVDSVEESKCTLEVVDDSRAHTTSIAFFRTFRHEYTPEELGL